MVLGNVEFSIAFRDRSGCRVRTRGLPQADATAAGVDAELTLVVLFLARMLANLSSRSDRRRELVTALGGFDDPDLIAEFLVEERDSQLPADATFTPERSFTGSFQIVDVADPVLVSGFQVKPHGFGLLGKGADVYGCLAAMAQLMRHLLDGADEDRTLRLGLAAARIAELNNDLTVTSQGRIAQAVYDDCYPVGRSFADVSDQSHV